MNAANGDTPQSTTHGLAESNALLSSIDGILSTVTPAGGEPVRYPRGPAQIQAIQGTLDKLDSIDCRDQTVVEMKQRLRADLADACARRFYGSWKLIIVSAVALVILALVSNPLGKLSAIAPADAQSMYDMYVTKRAKNVEINQALVDDPATEPAKRAKAVKWLAESKKRHEQILGMTPQQFMDWHNRDRQMRFFKWIPTLLIWLSFPVLYFLSARAPRYLVLRRYSLLTQWSEGWNSVGSAVGGVVADLLSTPPTVVTTTYIRNGMVERTEKSVDFSGVGMAYIIAFAVVALATLILYFYVIPALTLANFALNYGVPWFERRRLARDPQTSTSCRPQ